MLKKIVILNKLKYFIIILMMPTVDKLEIGKYKYHFLLWLKNT